MVNLKSEEMKKSLIYALLVLVAVSVTACAEDMTNDPLYNGVEGNGNGAGSDIEGEKIRFYLGVENDAEESRTTLSDISVVWSENDCVSVNNVLYNVIYDETGAPYLDVLQAEDGKYVAYYPGDYAQFSTTPQHFRMHPMQYYVENSFGPDANPMCATASIAAGAEKPSLLFKSMCGVLKLTVSGDVEIESIYVEDRAGGVVAGTMSYDSAKSILGEPTFTAAKRVSRKGVVLNCVKPDGTGVKLSSNGTTFHIVLPARTYASGLMIRISDTSHRCMTIDSATPRTISVGSVLITPTIKYAPAANCVLEEHFDLMVWGGDYIAGTQKGLGFTPFAANTPATTDATGYERTLFTASYDHSGSDFYSNSHQEYTDVNHNMSEQYLRSRGVYSCPWLFRVEERPGYIGVGSRASNGRGRYRTAPFTNLSGASKVAVEFKISYMATAETDVDVWVRNSGYISEAYIDGQQVDVSADRYTYTYATDEETGKLTGVAQFVIRYSEMAVPTNKAAVKTWHTVKLIVNDAYADTALDLYAALSSPSGKLGYYVDDVVVTKLKDQSGDMLKVLSYNIQNGMWADQGNSYANFIAFVKKHAPDICLWQEAKSSYKTEPDKDGKAESLGTLDKLSGKYLIDYNDKLQWGTVAGKYGHNDWDYGAYQDNFPVVITATAANSINLIQTLGNRSKGGGKQEVDDNVSHGGLHAKMYGVNIVSLHLWPQQYGKNVTGTEAQEESKKNNEGHLYRVHELEYMLGKTVLNPTYASEKNWIMTGDFNSRSRLDETKYAYGLSSPLYWAQNVILDTTDYCDVIHTVYGGKFIPSTGGGSRIDYVFASPAMMKRVVRARTITNEDDFTTITKPEGWPFNKYSDHRPILVEFDMSE